MTEILPLELMTQGLRLNNRWKTHIRSDWKPQPGVGIIVEDFGEEPDGLKPLQKQLKGHEITHSFIRGPLPEDEIAKLPFWKRAKARRRKGAVIIRSEQNPDPEAMLKVYRMHHLLRGLRAPEIQSH
ncbi:hypothetical protein HY994_03345 [Candidatus Micrarchaeota archaeon]|nr:hypothetical protein [Candidatus Micrarchaeota archaeon]